MKILEYLWLRLKSNKDGQIVHINSKISSFFDRDISFIITSCWSIVCLPACFIFTEWFLDALRSYIYTTPPHILPDITGKTLPDVVHCLLEILSRNILWAGNSYGFPCSFRFYLIFWIIAFRKNKKNLKKYLQITLFVVQL